MSSPENRVVSLTFDNQQFQQAMAQTAASLEQLRVQLQQFNANNGFAGLQQQVDSVNLANVSNGVDQLNSKFGALGAVAFSVIQRITNSAITAGRGIIDNLIDPLVQAGRTRALAIEQAKFLFRGLGMDVTATMDSALAAVRGTAYGLGEAATLAGVFGAAGVTAGDEMTGALRGVAGVAAITGRNFGEIGAVFQNIASLNRVYTNDLNSLALRGLGIGKIAEAMGMTVEELRAAATAGTIDFQTFAAAMNEAFGDHAVEANQTYTGSLANLRAALSRIGADVWTPTFAGLRVIFNQLAPAIDKVHEALMPLIDAFKEFVFINASKLANFIEGMDFGDLEDTLSHIPRIFDNVWKAVKSVLRPITQAFRDIFPADGVNQFQAIAMAIQRFTANLRISGTTAHTVRNIFRGIFSVFSIGFSVLKGVGSVIAAIFSGLTGGESTLLSFAGGVGKALMGLKEALVDGGQIEAFFDNLATKVRNFMSAISNSGPVQALSDAIRDLGKWIGSLFSGDSSAEADNMGSSFGRIGDRIDSISESGERLAGVWEAIKQGFNALYMAVSAWLRELSEMVGNLWDNLTESLRNGDFSQIADLFNVGLMGALGIAIHSFLRNGVNFNVMNKLTFNLKNMFNELRISLQAFQMEIRARALLKIAEAVAILTASLLVLSLIDSAALTKALVATAAGLSELMGAMMIMGKTGVEVAKLELIVLALNGLAAALVVFSIAVAIFGAMDTDTLAKGLAGAAASLTMLAVAGNFMQGSIGGAFAMGIMAGALIVMAGAVALFGMMELDTLAKGLIGIFGALMVIGGSAYILQSVAPMIAELGAALIPFSIGIALAAGAIALFALIGLEGVATGLIGIAGALAIFGAGALLLQNVIPDIAALGLALIPLAIGLGMVAGAIGIFALLGLENVAIGLLGISGALAIFGAGALLLQNVTPMIAALGLSLIPLAAGLVATAFAIQMFAGIGIENLAMGLLGIAASFAVLGIAASLLSETIPFLAAFGAALLLVAGAFALFGAGSYLLAEAFKITAEGLREIAALGPEAWDAIIDGAQHAITIIPDLAVQLAEGLMAALDVIIEALPEYLTQVWEIIGMLLEQVPEFAPKFAEAFIAIIELILTVVNEKSPEIIETGMRLLVNLLQGIRDNIEQVTMLVTEIIIKFLDSLTAQIPMLVAAGQNFLIAFLRGVASNIGGVVTAGITVIVSFLNGIASNIGRIVAAGVNIIVSFLNGIASNIGRIIQAGVNIIVKFIEGIRNGAHQITEAAANLVVDLVNDLSSSIDAHAGELRSAGLSLGYAIINGISGGMLERAADAVARARNIAGDILGAIRDTIVPGSPSKVTTKYGQAIAEGLTAGMAGNTSAVTEAKSLASNVIDQFKSITDELAMSLNDMDSFNPTITPVLDLTHVSAGADKISSLLSGNTISASVSSRRARVISADEVNRRTDVATLNSAASGPTEIKFEQNNYARDELSLDDIYRNTRSQIALAKKELGIR